MMPSVVEFHDKNMTMTEADDFDIIVDIFKEKSLLCTAYGRNQLFFL